MRVHAAILALAVWQGDPSDRTLSGALAIAVEETCRELEATMPSTPRAQRMRSELRRFRGERDGVLDRDTWLLVLVHLPAEMQRLLQTRYMELERGVAAVVEQQPQLDPGALGSIEDLLAELPHTTFTTAADTGPPVRRGDVAFEVEHDDLDVDEDGVSFPRVVWRDGEQSSVARMIVAVSGGHVIWMLEIEDPAPGRSVERLMPRGSLAGAQAAHRGLAGAIDWANVEILTWRPETSTLRAA